MRSGQFRQLGRDGEGSDLPVARARRRRHQADDQRTQVAHQARELREQVGELGELTQLRGGAARHVRGRHGAEAPPGVLARPAGAWPGLPLRLFLVRVVSLLTAAVRGAAGERAALGHGNPGLVAGLIVAGLIVAGRRVGWLGR